MLKAILFDLDGTLLDRDASIKLFIDNQYDRLHTSLSHIDKEKYTSRFLELDNHGYVWKDKVYRQLLEEFNITSLNWEGLLDDYLNQFKYHCVSFPHVAGMIEDLKSKGIALGIITNGYGDFQEQNLRALNIDKYFDVILISEREGIKKPDLQIFSRALDKLGVKPEESIFVGDHPINDIAAAKNVGMKTIWKKDKEVLRVEADAVIEDYAEFILLIETEFH